MSQGAPGSPATTHVSKRWGGVPPGVSEACPAHTLALDFAGCARIAVRNTVGWGLKRQHLFPTVPEVQDQGAT